MVQKELLAAFAECIHENATPVGMDDCMYDGNDISSESLVELFIDNCLNKQKYES